MMRLPAGGLEKPPPARGAALKKLERSEEWTATTLVQSYPPGRG